MFFKEIHLAKNHWSVKVLDWAFPERPTFYNFCPHFWLTIFALIISPILLFLKGIKLLAIGIYSVCSGLFERIEKYIDARNEEMAKKILDEKLVSEDELKAFAYYRYRWSHPKLLFRDDYYDLDYCKVKRLQKYFKILYKTDIWRSKIYQADSRTYGSYFDKLLNYLYKDPEHIYVKPTKPLSVKLETNFKKKPWWPKAILAAKILVTPIIIAVAIVALALVATAVYLLGRGLGWLWYWINHFFVTVNWAIFAKAMAWVFGIIGIVVILIIGMSLLVQYCRSRKFSIFKCERCKHIRQTIAKPFVVFFTLIGSVFTFFWIAIKSFKKDNCPAIIWED